MNGQWRTLIRHERRILARDRVVWAVVALLLTLHGWGIATGIDAMQQMQARVGAAHEFDDAQWAAARKAIDPVVGAAAADVRTAITNLTAVVPPAPLSLLGSWPASPRPHTYRYRQFNDDAPSQPTVGGRSLSNLFPESVAEHPRALRAGGIDAGAIVLLVLPLVIIALAHDLLSHEREMGTLALLQTAPVSRARLMAAKIAVRAALIIGVGVLVPGVSAAALGAILTGILDVSGVIIWMVAASTVCLIWFCCAVIVNLRSRQSSQMHAMVLVVAWVVVTLVGPAAVNQVAHAWAPGPQAATFADRERAAREEGSRQQALAFDAIRRAFDQRYPTAPAGSPAAMARAAALANEPQPVPHVATMLVAFVNATPAWQRPLTYGQLFAATRDAREAFIEQQVALVLNERFAAAETRARITRWATLFSPSTPFRTIHAAVTGADVWRHEQFLGALDAHVRRTNDVFRDRVIDRAPISPEEFDRLPRFRFDARAVRAPWEHLGVSVAWLGVLCGGLLVAAWRA